MSNRKTKEQVVKMLNKHVVKNFDGNKSAAATEWNEHPNVVYAVLNGLRDPSKKMLTVIGMKKDPALFYVEAGG